MFPLLIANDVTTVPFIAVLLSYSACVCVYRWSCDDMGLQGWSHADGESTSLLNALGVIKTS